MEQIITKILNASIQIAQILRLGVVVNINIARYMMWTGGFDTLWANWMQGMFIQEY